MIDCITHSMEYGEKSARHHTATQQPQRLCGKEDKTILILAPKTGNYQILARIEPYSIIRNPRSHSVVLVLDKSAEDGVVDCTHSWLIALQPPLQFASPSPRQAIDIPELSRSIVQDTG